MSDLLASEKIRKMMEAVVSDEIKKQTKDCFRLYKATVVSVPTASEPLCSVNLVGDSTILSLPVSSLASNISVGDRVWVCTTYNSFRNAIVLGKTNMDFSEGGATPNKHYGARWDKVQAQLTRMYDAESITTDTSNFGYFGSVNSSYSNPFDDIYPWSEMKLCNVDIELYRSLSVGESLKNCVVAWEGDPDFSYTHQYGVWRYRPEFYGSSWEDDNYRYFDVSDSFSPSYVFYPEAIVGRWFGSIVSLSVDGVSKNCLLPTVGMPGKRVALSTLHAYSKNYGGSIDSIYSIDADILLCIVEFANMNTQMSIGNGVVSLYWQNSNQIMQDATESSVIQISASAAPNYCIPGAIMDIGTSNGSANVGSFYIVSVNTNQSNPSLLDVTLNQTVTVTTSNYWSIHGLSNVADAEIGSKSGYIGTNGKCNSYYRGIVLFGNMFLYTLGAYANATDRHLWIATSDQQANEYDGLVESVHFDTGVILATSNGFESDLGIVSQPGILSVPCFCTEIGGNSNNPIGDQSYNTINSSNGILVRGGASSYDFNSGAFCAAWNYLSSLSYWYYSARPRLMNP